MSEEVHWLDDGSPYSARFNDRYRSRTGGVAQAVTVFLAGCGLPQLWAGKDQFTILETGFGLGLNFLTTWAAWEVDQQRCERLHYVSVEAYPVAAADIICNAQMANFANEGASHIEARLPVLAQNLAQAWEHVSPGIQSYFFANGRVQLTLAVGDVQDMLGATSCAADAVYLDGFSPAVNPQMWSPATLLSVARHCKPGTRLATYTVAKRVRLELAGLGFFVEKLKGLPPKRDRLEAVLVSNQAIGETQTG